MSETREAQAALASSVEAEPALPAAEQDADDAVVRRIVDAAALPELLARETALALLEISGAERAVLFVDGADGDIRVVASLGCEGSVAAALARAARRGEADGPRTIVLEPLGRAPEGARFVALTGPQPLGSAAARRVRMVAAVAQQGFALCAARDRSPAVDGPGDRSLEPLLPGFLAASAAMTRVVEQIQRLQGSDLIHVRTGAFFSQMEAEARALALRLQGLPASVLPDREEEEPR